MSANLRLDRILLIVVVAALVSVTALRLWLGQGLPLWLDETWTAVISGQPTWNAFWRQAWLDCNPPLYYLVMWPLHWLGQSDWALRLPSIIFVTLAGVLPIFWRPPGLSREASLTWAALICLWWPGIAVSLDARGYGLLLLISTAQTIAYARVLKRPEFGPALLWSVLGGLAILTHYYALYVVAVQGVLLLAVRRQAWWRMALAAGAFIPVFLWMAVQLPRLAEYARPDVAWYDSVSAAAAISYVAYLFGPMAWVFLLGIAAALAIAVLSKRSELTDLWLVAGSGFIAFGLALGIALIKPTLTYRYLTPMAPLTLLGLVLIVRRSSLASLVLVAWYFAFVLTPSAHANRLRLRALYGYEQQAEWLMKARPDQLVFLWDHPAAKILDPASLRQIGAFFFHRAGMEVETKTLVLRPDEDPNIRLPQVADGDHPGFIWIYNKARKSAAHDHPPRAFKGWRCVSTTAEPIGVIACVSL